MSQAKKRSKAQPKLTSFYTPTSKDGSLAESNRDSRTMVEDEFGSPECSVPTKRQKVLPSNNADTEQMMVDYVISIPEQLFFDESLDVSATESTPRAAGRMSRSYISSFRYDESDLSDVSSLGARTPLKTPAKKDLKAKGGTGGDEGQMVHLTFEFLKPNKIKDASGRSPSHEEYDCRTLLVPDAFMKKQTPAHKQWWRLKTQYFDTVLFFKIGKFYEMFHMDAAIGVEKLNLSPMGGKFLHCGFPEQAYGTFAERLIRMGYNIARVEQTETPAQMEARSKSDKVVRRELCRITTQATQTYSAFETEISGKVKIGGDDYSNYLMSICEQKDAEGLKTTRFGVAFVDCAVGQFYLCEFMDNDNFSTLRTLLAHNQPTQLLQLRSGLSKASKAIISSILGSVPVEELSKKREFLEADETLKVLLDDDYLGSNLLEWPEALTNMIADLDEPIPKSKADSELVLSALGGLLWYLRRCLIDVDLVTMKKFDIYTPVAILQGFENLSGPDRWAGRRMVLDGAALKSLHLLPQTDSLENKHVNPENVDPNFSLFNTINHCVTAFGRRTLRQWICAPSCDKKALCDRQDVVQFLCRPETKDLMEFGASSLKRVPDLDRLFQRIHTVGLKYRRDTHPDSRAQFFEVKRYNSRKIRDLCVALGGLERLQKLLSFFDEHYKDNEECPPLLRDCLGDKFEEMASDLQHFDDIIKNREKISKEGKIVPDREVDPDYDGAVESVEEVEKGLMQYLQGQRQKFGSNRLEYFGSGKNRYQLQVPEELTVDIGPEYELKTQKRGFRRYRTAELETLISNLTEKEKQRDALVEDFTRRVFADFDARKDKWVMVVQKMSIFDCLMSLARYCSGSSLRMCVPEFDFESDEPFLDIRKGYHPSLAGGSATLSSTAGEYIPNDTIFGGDESTPPVLLLTGANMGGKSTLMRQAANLVVLAQIGSLVPAESMRLTPVDRIFSRIGASDCIAAGQSTFFIELSETNVILRESTRHSLVIIDELGRGTSTFDGTAIASAVLKHVADKIKCRTVFSTHYHSLCTRFANHPNVALGHMSCLVENDDPDGDPSMENVTFLYTLVDGPSPKSYGFFTARMAGIKPELIRRAYQVSKIVYPDMCLE